jgi:hypothetical protein
VEGDCALEIGQGVKISEEDSDTDRETYREERFNEFFMKYFFDGGYYRHGTYSYVEKPPIEDILQSEIDKYYRDRQKYDFCVLYSKPSRTIEKYSTPITETDAIENIVRILGPLMGVSDSSCISSSSTNSG